MRPISTGWRPAALLFALPGKRSSQSLGRLTLAAAAAATVFGWQPAQAAVDENWAGPVISAMHSEAARETAPAARSGSQSDDEGTRPQRRRAHKQREQKAERRHRGSSRMASLERLATPAPLQPLSVIEWARPKFEAVISPAAIPPKEVAIPPKEIGPMVASLGRDFLAPSPDVPPGLTGERIHWLPKASVECLATPLRGVLTELAAAYGPITVRWTCRDKQLNARVGGAKRSYHLTGNAVDFNMTGNFRAILAFLKARKDVGGLKHYGGGAFHIDTGPRRTW